MSGTVKTFTVGIMFGSQLKLGKRVNLDWWILGPNYGSSNGKLSGQTTLTPSEQTSLKKEFDKNDSVLFWHTGGNVTLFSYEKELTGQGAN